MDLRTLLARVSLPTVLAVILALAAGGGLALVVTDGDPTTPDHTITVVPPQKVVVDPADPGPPITAPLKAVEAATEDAADGELAHEDLRGAPLTAEQRSSNEQLADRAGIDGLPPTLADGAAFEQRGCRTIPIGINYSSRTSTPTTLGHAHITVSPERPGWSDVLGIVNFFGTAGVGASSHYVIDGEGHCAYIVSESKKAWTSGNMNPTAPCQIEMIGVPGDNGWKKPAGLKKAALVLADCAKRWDVPIQMGNTAGCGVLRPGLLDHNELECGNDHWDICDPGDPAIGRSEVCAITRRVLAAVKAAGGPGRTLTGKEHRWVTSARKPKGTGHSRRYWCNQIRRRIDVLERPASGRDRAARRRILRRVARATC